MEVKAREVPQDYIIFLERLSLLILSFNFWMMMHSQNSFLCFDVF